MKSFILAFLILQQMIGLVQAQNTLGCNGTRYINDITQDLQRAVVQFGSNIDADNKTQNLYMDIWYPTVDTLSRRPVIIFAFGGGFRGGNRYDMTSFANAFAKKVM